MIGHMGARAGSYMGSHAWKTYAKVLQDATTKERSIFIYISHLSGKEMVWGRTFVVVPGELVRPG